jgi:hypothetical protein
MASNRRLVVKAMRCLAPLFLTTFLLACTTAQVYETGQAYQRNQCGRIPDKADYDRCVGNASTTYDTYKRQTGAAVQ